MYRGHKIVHHGGNTSGFTALATLVPDKNAGIVILTNMNSTFLPMALSNAVADIILGLDEIDWSARFKAENDKLTAMVKEMGEEEKNSCVPNAPLSHKPEDYAGRFEHPAYGVIEVTYSNGEFMAKHNLTNVAFKHFHYDIFEFITIFDIRLLATYKINSNGGIEAIAIPFEEGPGMQDILFKKNTENA
jgi:hypothetical protein